jgi:hypothetical protein
MRRKRALVGLMLIMSMSLARVAGGSRDAHAQEPNRVGLVVAHGDGTTVTRCVEFSEPEITGYDLLIRSGLDTVFSAYGGTGMAVCAVDGEGCPAGDCFCQCQGSPCVYWAYYRLKDGQWEYSGLGAGGRAVSSGEVEGWAWGEGGTEGGAMPPVIAFDQICAPPATDTPTATATRTSSPEPTATSSSTPTPTPTATTPPPTSTPAPTDTPHPTSTSAPAATAPSPTPTPTATRSPTTTPTWVNDPSPTPVSAHTATPTATAASSASTTVPEQGDGAMAASLPGQAAPTDGAALAATSTLESAPTPTSPSYGALHFDTATPMPTAIPRATRAREATPTMIVATTISTLTPHETTGAPPLARPAPTAAQGGDSYLLFGVLAGGLVAGLIVLQVRKRR